MTSKKKEPFLVEESRTERARALFDFLSFAFAGLCGVLLFIVVLKTPSNERMKLIEERLDAIEQRIWHESYTETREAQQKYLEERQ